MERDAADSSTSNQTQPQPSVQNVYNIQANSVSIYSDSSIQQNAGQTVHDVSSTQHRKQTSIDHVRQPIPNFSETKKFTKLLNLAKSESTLILQCHGVPGSGKSEIVRQLAQKFPYEDESSSSGIFVKWVIQYDGASNVQNELEELVKQMQTHSLLQTPQCAQDILSDLKKNLAGSLVTALVQCNIPTLLIIEDTTPNNCLLKDLLRCINQRKTSSDSPKLHVYLTTRKRSVVFSEEERKSMDHYKLEKIAGFDQDESVKFLLRNKPDAEGEEAECINLFKRFSGSPLGLRVAKAYCQKIRCSYAEYLKWIKDGCEESIHQEEEEKIIRDEYGKSGQHIFQAIVKPFLLNDDSSETDKLNWNVLSCLSYFHHDKIPEFLLHRSFQLLRNKTVKNLQYNNKRDSGFFISKLLEFEMCTFIKEKQLIVFHEVVLHAFQICQPKSSSVKFNQLRDAISIMAGLLTKDLRSRINLENMRSLTPHVYNLLENVDRMFEIPKNYEKSLLLRMVLSHVYEITAAITMGHPSFYLFSQKFYKRALDICWNKDSQCCLTESVTNSEDINEIAAYVVEMCAVAGKKLPEGFITDYELTVFNNIAADSLEFLEKASQDKEKFEKVKEALKAEEMSKNVLNMLRDCGVFLKEETHKHVFFAERIASILHSWSRLILYADEEKVNSLRDEAIWRSSLSHAISVQCRQSFDVSLLSERLSYTTGKIPIILKGKGDAIALKEIKDYCKNLLEPTNEDIDGETYENGLQKKMVAASHPMNQKQMFTNLLKINTRLLKNMEDISTRHELVENGKTYAETLFQLGEKNEGKVFKSSIFLIHCAKFYAASKDFGHALICFDKFFKKTNLEDDTYFGNYCWATYNFARAVVCYQKQEQKAAAIERVKAVLERIDALMRPSLKSKLNEMLIQLNQL